MQRKTWVMPMTLVQKFEANETVAADTQCWNVKCERAYVKGHIFGVGWYDPPGIEAPQFHDQKVCGTLTNQVLRDTDNDGFVDQMVEYGNGTKICTLYTDESYSVQMSPSDVNPESGNYIYWVNHDVMDFYHKGIPQTADASHPNRS